MSDTLEVLRWAYAEGLLTEKPTKTLANRYKETRPKPAPYRAWDDTKTPALILDIDGTIARMTTRGPFDTDRYLEDELHELVLELVEMYRVNQRAARRELAILVTTGRYEEHRSVTQEWLRREDVIYDRLLMRADGDHRNDAIIKREIFEREIEPYHNVVVALDDRNRVVEMWRSLGIPTLQCGPGDF